MSESLPRTVQDTEFGSIRLEGGDGVLEPRAVFGPHQVEVRVEIAHEQNELTEAQRQVLRSALNLPSDVLARAAAPVVQNYDIYRDMIGDEELPPLTDPALVWDQVDISYLHVPRQAEGARPGFLLYGECSWDPEHGLVIRFRDGVADAASQQGELGLDDD